MKKTAIGMTAVVVGFALLALSAGAAPATARPGYETYVVRSGDTLSKISGRLFGDVQRWREILKDNPQITNPNRIFPGDILLVPAPQTAAGDVPADLPVELVAAPAPATDQDDAAAAAAAAAATAAAAGEQPAAGADAVKDDSPAVPDLPVQRVRPVAVVNPVLYRSAGFIADGLPTLAIVASQDDRNLLGSDDAAIINAPVPAGTRFKVVRANRRVFHPATRRYLGWLVQVLGTAEVTCRGERNSTIALRAMNEGAAIGDYLLPIDPNDVLEPDTLPGKLKPICVPAGPPDGTIVAFNDELAAAGDQELAYIDRGTSSGVAPGQRFIIYRETAPEGRVTVGELQVLRVGAHTATALITTSIEEIQIGSLLRAH